MRWPNISTMAINDFPGTAWSDLASCAFPTLFFGGHGDPYGATRNANKETFHNKVKYLLMYSENVGGELVSRFAAHPRFVCWINNIIYRHRTLSQGEIYLKQNPGDATLTIEEIRDMIANNDTGPLLNRIKRYMANIPGTPSYWYQENQKLKAIIESKGLPHVWYTLSFADFFDPLLRDFLNLPDDATQAQIQAKLRANKHHVNWFIEKKMRLFTKAFIETVLQCNVKEGGWCWNRFEFQLRGVLHQHGLARFGGKYNKDIHSWAARAVIGHTIETDVPAEKRTQAQRQAIIDGKRFGQALCDFHDELICNDLTKRYEEFVAPKDRGHFPMGHRMEDIVDHDLDQFNLTVSLQRHRCKQGSCIKPGTNLCKYDYPKKLNPTTHLKFKRKQKKDGTFTQFQVEIVSKRVNDTNISNHHRGMLKYWRANCDFTLVLDAQRIMKYVTKYQTKAEKNSDFFKAALITIFDTIAADPNLNTRKGLRQVMTKVLGQRDVSVDECLQITLGKI
jgi:hypothetical protein